MHPQLFLRTFWNLELRPQVFVAMSFDERYRPRFEEVIAPAVRGVKVGGKPLEPYRVDLSKTGDSILADIVDGIAHAQMVLADVSSVGKDATTGQPYRNANVMYEVGLALACRQTTEVLVVRDDHDRFLFDVSTIPHMTLDFTEKARATAQLNEEMDARLNRRKLANDARVRLALATLAREEAKALKDIAALGPHGVWGQKSVNLFAMVAVPRLLDKQLITLAGEFEGGHTAYRLTAFGAVVAHLLTSGLRKFTADQPDEKKTEEPEAGTQAEKEGD